MKARRIQLHGVTVTTRDPADFILARKTGGVWQVICRGGIFKFDPSAPAPFNVERMTKEQVKDRMALFKEFGNKELRRFRPYSFADFQARISHPECIHAIDSVDQAQEADEREVAWRAERRQEHMRMLFGERREER